MPDLLKALLKRGINYDYKFNKKRNKIVYKVKDIFYKTNWIEIFEVNAGEYYIKTKSGNEFQVENIDDIVRYNYELWIEGISNEIKLEEGFKDDFARLNLERVSK